MLDRTNEARLTTWLLVQTLLPMPLLAMAVATQSWHFMQAPNLSFAGPGTPSPVPKKGKFRIGLEILGLRVQGAMLLHHTNTHTHTHTHTRARARAYGC